MIRLTIGDSTRGYHTAEIAKRGIKYHVVADTINGDAQIIRRAVRVLNEGTNHVLININGDDLPFSVRKEATR